MLRKKPKPPPTKFKLRIPNAPKNVKKSSSKVDSDEKKKIPKFTLLPKKKDGEDKEPPFLALKKSSDVFDEKDDFEFQPSSQDEPMILVDPEMLDENNFFSFGGSGLVNNNDELNMIDEIREEAINVEYDNFLAGFLEPGNMDTNDDHDDDSEYNEEKDEKDEQDEGVGFQDWVHEELDNNPQDTAYFTSEQMKKLSKQLRQYSILLLQFFIMSTRHKDASCVDYEKVFEKYLKQMYHEKQLAYQRSTKLRYETVWKYTPEITRLPKFFEELEGEKPINTRRQIHKLCNFIFQLDGIMQYKEEDFVGIPLKVNVTPNHYPSHFTEPEDHLLLLAVMYHGTLRWEHVQEEYLPNKPSKTIAIRWRNRRKQYAVETEVLMAINNEWKKLESISQSETSNQKLNRKHLEEVILDAQEQARKDEEKIQGVHKAKILEQQMEIRRKKALAREEKKRMEQFALEKKNRRKQEREKWRNIEKFVQTHWYHRPIEPSSDCNLNNREIMICSQMLMSKYRFGPAMIEKIHEKVGSVYPEYLPKVLRASKLESLLVDNLSFEDVKYAIVHYLREEVLEETDSNSQTKRKKRGKGKLYRLRSLSDALEAYYNSVSKKQRKLVKSIKKAIDEDPKDSFSDVVFSIDNDVPFLRMPSVPGHPFSSFDSKVQFEIEDLEESVQFEIEHLDDPPEGDQEDLRSKNRMTSSIFPRSESMPASINRSYQNDMRVNLLQRNLQQSLSQSGILKKLTPDKTGSPNFRNSPILGSPILGGSPIRTLLNLSGSPNRTDDSLQLSPIKKNSPLSESILDRTLGYSGLTSFECSFN